LNLLLILVLAVLTLEASATTSIAGVSALALLLLTISGVALVARSVVLIAWVEVLLVTTSTTHLGHELLNDMGDLVHVSGVDSAVAIFLEMALEVLLVFVVLVLEVTVLFDLVVVHVKGFVVHHEILRVLRELSLIRGLVANESVGALVVLGFKNAARLNFTKLSEHVSEVLLGLVLETFDVEVASLL
jgi:hypothetical protein